MADLQPTDQGESSRGSVGEKKSAEMTREKGGLEEEESSGERESHSSQIKRGWRVGEITWLRALIGVGVGQLYPTQTC